MRLDEITCKAELDILRQVQAEIESTDIGIFGWKTELRDDYESRITGEPPPTLYVYRTKSGTAMRDMDRIFLAPIIKEYDVEATMRDLDRVEYRVRSDRPTNCEVPTIDELKP